MTLSGKITGVLPILKFLSWTAEQIDTHGSRVKMNICALNTNQMIISYMEATMPTSIRGKDLLFIDVMIV